MPDPSRTRREFRVGDRVLVTGGYDLDPPWLKGRQGYTGTLVELRGTWAVVELDEEVLLNGEWPDFGSGSRKEVGSQRTPKGRWLALAFGWVGDVWSSPTGRLHVGLCSDKPKLGSVPLGGGIGAWVESHATMQHLGAPRDD